ncbi:ABC transporter substrate-binding protein [Clostridium beijerinckii]|uniref:Amino acid ABC transporter substrate-binding protein n=1 Tax=Clostridium beijerinckii TaxID=1520 RepID=A0A7X9SRM0_CLOBE|nr:ABC transporter substrate-binding protein [Clostridium beijerinckii]NMF06773.1 amino acid ABC transporter substrate-binding protein [Clostridium beijerinckii]
MKKIFTSIVIINIIGIIFGLMIAPTKTIMADSSIEKDRLETIKEKGIITIAAPSKEIPFFWINQETNEMSGIDADIINEIIRRLGINKVEIKEVTFANLLDKFNTDDSIDIAVGGIFITPESEKLAAFTQPLYKESETVIVPRFSKINFISDLKNAVVGVEKGTIFEDLAKKWKENNLIKDVLSLDSTTDLFNAINNGKIDAGLADSIIINYYIKEKNPLLRQLKGYTPELQGVMGIAVKKDDVSLLNALDKAINDMKADGALYSILVKNGLDKNNMINN